MQARLIAGNLVLSLLFAAAMPAQEVPGQSHAAEKTTLTRTAKLSFSPDGRLLAVLMPTQFQIRDGETGQLLRSVQRPRIGSEPGDRPGREPWLLDLCWSPDGKRIAVASEGIEIWDQSRAVWTKRFPAPRGLTFHALAWSRDGKHIAAHSPTGVTVFDTASGRSIELPVADQSSGGAGMQIGGIAWAPDGRSLAIVVEDAQRRFIHIWNARSRRFIRKFAVGLVQAQGSGASGSASVIVVVEAFPRLYKLEWSPDGRVLALTADGLSLWDARSGALLVRPRQREGVLSMAWSPDSKLLHIGTPHQLRTLRRDTGAPVYAVESVEWMRVNAISRRGDRRACAYNTGEIHLWRGKEDIPHVRIQADGRPAAGF
jgi:WD40 repeat protein